jgi:peptide-methionine (S)-S-oxide reductase
MGTQYRSVIFYHTPEQKSALDLQNVACNLLVVLLCHSRCFLPPSAEVAEEVKDKVQKEHYPGTQIVTQIVPAGQYWSAEVPTIPHARTWRVPDTPRSFDVTGLPPALPG